MVMAQVSIPIERNLGNGQISAARSRKLIAEAEQTIGYQTFKADLLALRKAIAFEHEQVIQAEVEWKKSKELVESENYKFKSGGGNLFLVNLREQAKASAEASFHESRLMLMKTILYYKSMINSAE
jgi:hypothetical protein